MNLSIFGLGYVGCVATGCLAQQGHRVIGVDPQPTKVDFINAGKATIIEAGIEDLIAQQRAAGRISATVDGRSAVRDSDVSFICVGTPPTPNGHLDLATVFLVAGQIGEALREKSGRHVIALRSTVLPGTNERVAVLIAQTSGKRNHEDFAVVSNPEFLREGTSIDDFLNPCYTLVGSGCPRAVERMREVYASLSAPFIVTEPRIAELMKYVCNSFHALKITFANEVGNICQALAIDSQELMRIFCQDTRLNISPAYLKPGFAYGGSCLPKDLRAFRTLAHDHYLQSPVLESIERSNELQKELVFNRIVASGRQRIGFLGLAFKAGTDDLRESPIVDVIERLLGKGFEVRIYDRHVHVAKLTGANKEYILQKIPYISRFITDNLSSVLDHAELIVVVNKEPGLREALLGLNPEKIIHDLANLGISQPAPVVACHEIATGNGCLGSAK